MRYQKIFFVLAVVCQLSMSHAGAQNIILKNSADSASFYLGYMYGKQIAEAGIDLNVYAMSSGLRNAIAKTPANSSDEEISQFLQKYFTNLQAKANEKNIKESQDFLAANSKKQGVVTLPSGLQYKVIKEGTGIKPEKGDNVEVTYHGTLIDGTVFDSAKERGEPVTFPVDGVIAGFSEALMMMKEGSVWEIYIPAELGYGENVNPASGIKPNSALIFEIDLLKVVKGGDDGFEEFKIDIAE